LSTLAKITEVAKLSFNGSLDGATTSGIALSFCCIIHGNRARSALATFAIIFAEDNILISASVNKLYWEALVHFV